MKRFSKAMISVFFAAGLILSQNAFAQSSDKSSDSNSDSYNGPVIPSTGNNKISEQTEDEDIKQPDDDYVSEGDYYEEEEEKLDQNGPGDQFLNIRLMPVFPLNFGDQLFIGGALNIGYNRFLTKYFAVGADLMFGYNPTIGSNLFTYIPVTIGITFQPYVWRFEFPMSINIGFVIQNYVQYNYFPGLILRGSAGAFYRMNENWSFGAECLFYWMPQWVGDPAKDDHYLGIAASLSARYHF